MARKPAGRSNSGGGNPHLTDDTGPRDGRSDMVQRGGKNTTGGYASNEGKSSISGVPDTGGGNVSELKRSAPNVGVYQSKPSNAGGAATKNYDAKGGIPEYSAPGLEALRKEQDRRSGRSEND